MKHYNEQLSAYLHHELPKEERQLIAEHLLQCEECRKEHDEIKLGVALASNLSQADAPQSVWNEISHCLNGHKKPLSVAKVSFLDLKILIPAAAAILIISVFGYLALRRNFAGEHAENTPKSDQIQASNSNEWKVENLTGDRVTIADKEVLTVGETLETDKHSRLKVQVADIGNVEIAPNSRVKLVNSQSTEHRLSLEKGTLRAQIFAPPRLFIVDTPSAAAVDLGCAYTLEVDDFGNTKLHVTSGFVALERDGKESIVPAGALAMTKKGIGIGTPFAENSTVEFREALRKLDFENGGNRELQIILKSSGLRESLTLWHLLSRVPKDKREAVFEVLSSYVKPPENVTKSGILNLDEQMLDDWWKAVEAAWFG